MNERIRELAKKSGFSLDSTGIYTAKLEHLPITENMEKFAELIVRDCLKEIKDMLVEESEKLYPNNKQTTQCVNDRLLDAYDNISEHFGVEE